jgi:hypothetical protein
MYKNYELTITDSFSVVAPTNRRTLLVLDLDNTVFHYPNLVYKNNEEWFAHVNSNFPVLNDSAALLNLIANSVNVVFVTMRPAESCQQRTLESCAHLGLTPTVHFAGINDDCEGDKGLYIRTLLEEYPDVNEVVLVDDSWSNIQSTANAFVNTGVRVKLFVFTKSGSRT